jgi:hypothetical protein
MALLGKAMEVTLRGHFLARDREGNGRGWPRSHFWNRRVRANTSLTEVTPTAATVSVASPEFAHKMTGGTIRPKRGRALAIPLTAEAGKAGSPREGGMPGLFKVPGLPFLAVTKGRGRSRVLEIQYKLQASVTQPADPRALPDMAAVGRDMEARTAAWVARAVGGTPPAGGAG